MKTHPRIHATRTNRAGNATVIAVITMLVIGGLAGVVLSVSQRHKGEVSALVDQNRAFFVANAGANDAIARVEAGDQSSYGSAKQPVEFAGGTYWVEIDEDEDDDAILRLTAFARSGLQQKGIEVVLEEQIAGVFRNAIFAGNSGGEAGYVLDLGGTNLQGDKVYGDVYSGGSVKVTGDAEVFGTIRAYESVTGKGTNTAETGKKQAIPDIAGMDYAATSDIKVATEFATGGAAYKSDEAGGKAWQLPETNPAHIFRKNPSDRTAETGGTVKDDYFLEDPYETVKQDVKMDGSDAYPITLSGTSGEPGKSSNQKIFFIDGNLWIHNYQTMSFKFAHKDAAGVQVTFVVKGNLYISDNVFYTNAKTDGVAFVAMKDPAVTDSGNIYFGDSQFGTLERMYGYMYAENNFHDVNLNASGSAKVELFGNMTAGNQVKINRDFTVKIGGIKVKQHTKLTVDFDERLADGELELPGLPRVAGGDGSSFEVLSWREVDPE